MKYKNPIIKGFYPDPSVCRANGKYYMVCSSFQYFPGIPLFESTDLVNWTQLGYVLTRKSQLCLDGVPSSGGIFAPTIRFNNGRFYVVTTNNTQEKNFYVYTDDIYGQWSEPIFVEQGGIDPSLYFENGRAFFISNSDCGGKAGIVQCEIDIISGKKLTDGRAIWNGSGGRYLESPHMYKIGESYYLMAAEGGTEYGHMITCARSTSVWGPFEGFPHNPVLTNRNKAPYFIQGIGHGELVCDEMGSWHIISLGFRQLGKWQPFHTLGREVFLTPVSFDENGLFTAGRDGTTDEEYELCGSFEQKRKNCFTFENTAPDIDWCYLRNPDTSRYLFGKDYILRGSGVTLDETASPTWLGMRQHDFNFTLSVKLRIDGGEAGVTVYMCEKEHYDIAVRKRGNAYEALLRLNIGGIKHIQNTAVLESAEAVLLVRGTNMRYDFSLLHGGTETLLGGAESKYLSSEVSEGFTGVMLALYAVGENTAEFSDFTCEYFD